MSRFTTRLGVLVIPPTLTISVTSVISRRSTGVRPLTTGGQSPAPEVLLSQLPELPAAARVVPMLVAARDQTILERGWRLPTASSLAESWQAGGHGQQPRDQLEQRAIRPRCLRNRRVRSSRGWLVPLRRRVTGQAHR